MMILGLICIQHNKGQEGPGLGDAEWVEGVSLKVSRPL